MSRASGTWARIYSEIWWVPTVLGLVFSFLGTFIFFGFLAQIVAGWPEPNKKAPGESIVIASLMAIGGYLLLWSQGKLMNRVASRQMPQDRNEPQ
jgi:hypothetical protein